MVLHDLNLPARYTGYLNALNAGRLQESGHPVDVLTMHTVQGAFGLENPIITDPASGKPLMFPMLRHHRATATPCN